jgi:uncharacterized membrane protein YkvA (DUF1232 family)
MAFGRSKEMARLFKRELTIYQRVLKDERTPARAKVSLALAIGYLCMPFDLIPDFIPVIGHLDDAVIIPALVFVALRFVPREIVSEHRGEVVREQAIRSGNATSRLPSEEETKYNAPREVLGNHR